MNKLEKYLTRNAITQRGFARKIGLQPGALHSIVKGRYLPSIQIAYEIEQATNGVVSLYDWVKKEPKSFKDDVIY